MTSPTSPIELVPSGTRLAPPHPLPAPLLAELGSVCQLVTDATQVADASRDWWPIALHWALDWLAPASAGVVARPASTAQVAAVAAVCNAHRIPIVPAGGRSGVCGGTVPAFGGVLLDLTRLDRIGPVDARSGIVAVDAGVFGPDLERLLNVHHGLTVGHFPQSFELATVGGWVACRGAGQYSTRYGKIEDMVVGLEVVLADGTIVRTGGAPAAAAGPDLNQVFVGSEGTLGVITRVWLRAHPVAEARRRAAFWFADLSAAIEACRRIVRSGATPAVLRIYDSIESARSHGGDGSRCALLVHDEGAERIVEATIAVVEHEATALGEAGDPALVAAWFEHRNDTSALQALTRKGLVVDTMEVAAPWSRLDAIYADVTTAIRAVPHARLASAHLSHSYLDGACLYFTFAAAPPPDQIESTYVALWDAGQRAALAAGANLSHHHGIGLNRARFVEAALGEAFEVLASIKSALDPHGIMNPGKLGLRSPFGEVAWPG